MCNEPPHCSSSLFAIIIFFSPGGHGILLDGRIHEEGESWSAVIDDANDWVQVGVNSVCNLYSETELEKPSWGTTGSSNEEITRHIMCCQGAPYVDSLSVTLHDATDDDLSNSSSGTEVDSTGVIIPTQPMTDEEENTSGMTEMKMTELEVQIQNLHQPMWFNNEEGWQGASYNDGQAFCESIPHGDGTLYLCPLDAYCPNGFRDSEPLYLQMDAFDGDQWAPISGSFNSWVNIGKLEVEDPLTCLTHIEIFGHNPTWGLDGSKPELKDNILCCVDVTGSDAVNNDVSTVNSDSQSDSNTKVSHEGSAMVDVGKHAVDASIMNTFNPAWFSAARGGWDGGSHNDAVAFCEKLTGSHGKSMELCPYHALCPQGPSMPVVGGHDVYFEEEGEQWAPIYGQHNHWVMIGNGDANISSLCQSHVKLTGEEPFWGLDWSHKEMKKYVMCCSPSST